MAFMLVGKPAFVKGSGRVSVATWNGRALQLGGPASTPHRISLRLAAWILRLPLEGGVIPALRTGDVVYTLDREHGLHPAKQSGKKPCAGLKNHSPLEGESARPGRSPQSSRWGANTPSRK